MKKPSKISPRATAALTGVAERLRRARMRRGWTQTQMSMFLMLGEATYRRIEKGSPAVAIGAWVSAFEQLGLLSEMDGLLLYDNDRIGASIEQSRKSVRRKKQLSLDELAERL